MIDLMKELREIQEKQTAILEILQATPRGISRDERMITVSEICNDLQVSRAYFYRAILPRMPFMQRMTTRGEYRGRLDEYRRWKKTELSNVT